MSDPHVVVTPEFFASLTDSRRVVAIVEALGEIRLTLWQAGYTGPYTLALPLYTDEELILKAVRAHVAVQFPDVTVDPSWRHRPGTDGVVTPNSDGQDPGVPPGF